MSESVMDQDRVLDALKDNIENILKELGENAQREGLLKTPYRVAKSLRDLTAGYTVDIDNLINRAIFNENYNEMVVVKDIRFYSLCEHHLLPFFGTASVAYIPNGKIIGLSKIPKLVEVFAKRLQVQERMTQQIAEMLQSKLSPLGVAVVIEARHLCMEMRGAKSQDSPTITSAMLGAFRENARTREEFLSFIHR
ncbi:MAG: GTP cyclohydrolase 1 [Elusimicrobia bacterium]|nr:GTP cyclohydrolase 1 [Elusimicrobiota bacterium]